jgi:hypothetical protein
VRWSLLAFTLWFDRDAREPASAGTSVQLVDPVDPPGIGAIDLGQALTVFGIVAVANVINLIDGVDGGSARGQPDPTASATCSGVAISSSTGANAVTAASKIEDGHVAVRVWNNGDAAFVDGKTFSLIAF